MKKITTFIEAGIIILVILLVPPTFSAGQAIAQPTFLAHVEGVDAFWSEAEVQVGDFTLTEISLTAVVVSESGEGNKQTNIRLGYTPERDGEPVCVGCFAELTTTDDVLEIRGFNSATLSLQ